ncbi:hypothetical protein [Limosilactobacillus allomucosae]|uniref:hypothetical protein n=1 Tax=Limosilactobacillus allomucosae TaxID=3142938 RepID=UPI00326389F4
MLILIIIIQYLIKKYGRKKETIKNKQLLQSPNSKPVINKSAKQMRAVRVSAECSTKESVNNKQLRKPSHTRPTINKTVKQKPTSSVSTDNSTDELPNMDSQKDQLIENSVSKTDNVTQTSDKLTIIVKNGKKFCQYPLEDDWYLTRIRKIPCLGKKHNIIKFYAVANANFKRHPDHHLVRFPAYYCQECDRIMVKEPVYQEIRNDCRLLCNVVNESFWTPKFQPQHTNKHFVATFGNEESILHILGYNVNAQIGLTTPQRHAILRQIIINGQLSQSQIEHHLRYLIRRNRSNRKFRQAIEKWLADLNYVSRLDVNYSRIPINAMRALLNETN